MTARERTSLLLAAASQAAQTSQLRHAVTTQSAGQVPKLHGEVSCVSVHAAPSSETSRLRCRMPVSQEAEQALHSCKMTHTKADVAQRAKPQRHTPARWPSGSVGPALFPLELAMAPTQLVRETEFAPRPILRRWARAMARAIEN